MKRIAQLPSALLPRRTRTSADSKQHVILSTAKDLTSRRTVLHKFKTRLEPATPEYPEKQRPKTFVSFLRQTLDGLFASKTPLRMTRCLLPALLAFLFSIASAFAADAPAKSESKITLAPEVEGKLQDFAKKAGEAKLKFWAERMKKETENIVKATGLSAEKARSLDAPAKKAADQCIGDWRLKLGEGIRVNVAQVGDQIFEQLDAMMAQIDMVARNDWYLSDYPQPFEHPIWLDALKHTLTPEQAAAWKQAQAERTRQVDAEIGNRLAAQMTHVREQYRQDVGSKATEIKLALQLPKDRVEKLEALVNSSIEEAGQGWLERARKKMRDMDDEVRRQMLKGMGFYIGVDRTELPSKRSQWKDGVAKLFTADELNRVQVAREVGEAKRAKITARLMLALLDEKVVFTASQRERLLPIVERLAMDPALSRRDGQPYDYNYRPPALFFTAASKVAENEVKPILEEVQWKHWQDACKAKPRSRVTKPKEDSSVSTVNVAVEDVEGAISDFLYEQTRLRQKEMLTEKLLKLEDILRVTQLSGSGVNRLQTAARGVVDNELALWKMNVENMVRSNIRGATGANIKRRLDSLEEYQVHYGVNRGTKESLWDKTVKAELTEVQLAAWRKELDERAAFHDQAIAANILSELDRRVLLNQDQWDKLQSKIVGVMKEFGPDIMRMFSGGNSVPWYLQSYSMYIPMAGIEEKELKTILKPDQMDTFKKMDQSGGSYWESIQSNHEQRMREKQR